MAILSQIELLQAQEIINRTPAGDYELKDLYGAAWKSVVPTTFGGRFKETVSAGHLQRIRLSLLKTNNHNTYEIYNNQ